MNDYGSAPRSGDVPCRWCGQRIRKDSTDGAWFHVVTNWVHCGFTNAEPEDAA